MTFAYRIRFLYCGGNRLDSDQTKVIFTLDGQSFRLKSATGKLLRVLDAVVLSSSGFDTEPEALSHGRKMKQCLSLCGPMLKIGIDVGKEETLSKAGRPLKEMLRGEVLN